MTENFLELLWIIMIYFINVKKQCFVVPKLPTYFYSIYYYIWTSEPFFHKTCKLIEINTNECTSYNYVYDPICYY